MSHKNFHLPEFIVIFLPSRARELPKTVYNNVDTENIKVTKQNNSNWDSWDLQLYGAALRDDSVFLLEANEEQPVKSSATQVEINKLGKEKQTTK
ncbi:hypothetical protein HDU92_001236 [Lobulomyces angularis]|nr:hypothetical protein HDU92_001236 [Lobulomyces angularis]